ncbi:MAG TPA: lysophospholipid acyltransferase family protein [Steroidobacteraceae bacterium]|nr:lysophospholipid acyltransferase family protein [Steroidobacteraceae bacterium]
MQWLLSLVLTTFMFVSTMVFAGLVIATGWMPYVKRYALVRLWARTELGAARFLCGLGYVVEGREHIPDGCHISMWRHSSAWETLAQMVIFPPQAWVLKREILWIPVVGWATRLMHPIAINRAAGGTAVSQVVAQGQQRLRDGMWVLVYPEGTRVAVGQRRRYGISGALLGAAAGCKIVPVAHDAGRYWARRGLLKRRGTIRVVIGPPIDCKGRDARDIIEEVRAWIDGKTAELGG